MQMLYMPVCLEGRFAREGFAQHIDMPMRNRPLSPITYTSIPQWAPLISCPRDCRGYRNRPLARILALFKRDRHVEDSGESTQGEGRWKWWIAAICVPIAATLLAAVLGWLGPEGRGLKGLEKPKTGAPPSSQSVLPQPQPASPPTISAERQTATKTQHAKLK